MAGRRERRPLRRGGQGAAVSAGMGRNSLAGA